MKHIIFALMTLLQLALFYSCSNANAQKETPGAAFEYRDVYLPDYNKEANDKLGLNTIDEDWGLWGHNLGDILPETVSREIYSEVKGEINDDQFCFSSEKLFGYIKEYIDNKYLFEDNKRFAILPNDNAIVCLCEECKRAGNTPGDASPAVFNMIEKLAKKYPDHQFFTSYYSTTKGLPTRDMPSNVGVLVSAMDYPLSAVETSQEKNFLNLLEQWKGKTDKIYIWDYIQNFDDYFTPVPIFTIMQRRLKNYRNLGVDGVFLNGSAPDYSTFSKLHKAVLAKMLVDPDLDWQELLRTYAKEFYPVAGDDIADFIIAQEEMIASNGKKIPLYEGVEKAIDIYLPAEKFVDFYNKIVEHKRVAGEEERAELENMTDAMAFTFLELKRINHMLTGTEKLKERLGRLKSQGIEAYNEGCWSIDKYLSGYNFMEQNAAAVEGSNLLKGVKLNPLTPLDEDYPDITILTDGQLGIPSNYHNGNLISSADPVLKIAVPRVSGMKKLKVWMVYNPGFKITLPSEVFLTVGGLKQPAKIPVKPDGNSGHTYLEFDIPASGDIVLNLTKDPEGKTMALDEIEAFN